MAGHQVVQVQIGITNYRSLKKMIRARRMVEALAERYDWDDDVAKAARTLRSAISTLDFVRKKNRPTQ